MKVRYSRLWSFGNYENEKVELEEDFPSTMSYAEALTLLMKLVNNDHEIRVKIRDVSQRLGRRESDLKDFQTNNIRAGSLFTSEGVEASYG